MKALRILVESLQDGSQDPKTVDIHVQSLINFKRSYYLWKQEVLRSRQDGHQVAKK